MHPPHTSIIYTHPYPHPPHSVTPTPTTNPSATAAKGPIRHRTGSSILPGAAAAPVVGVGVFVAVYTPVSPVEDPSDIAGEPVSLLLAVLTGWPGIPAVTDEDGSVRASGFW